MRSIVYLFIILFTLFFFSCKKENRTDCFELRELDWRVNNSSQVSTKADISNTWYLGIDGYWLVDFESQEYLFGVNNRIPKFTESELNTLSEDEWKLQVNKRCIWGNLHDLTFFYFIVIKDGLQVETRYNTGEAYYSYFIKEHCKFLEINIEASYTDTTENIDYKISARVTYEYTYKVGENYTTLQ